MYLVLQNIEEKKIFVPNFNNIGPFLPQWHAQQFCRLVVGPFEFHFIDI